MSQYFTPVPAGHHEILMNDVTTASTVTTDNDKLLPINKLFTVEISGTATVVIRGRLKGATDWAQLASVTSSGSYANAEPWHQIQAEITTISSGNVSVIMGF